jgi:hypothetical protein
MDSNGFDNGGGVAADPMYQWMMQRLGQQAGTQGQQGQGGQGGGGGMGALLKAFGGGKQQQGQYGGTDAGTGDDFTQFSGGDFGGGDFG